MVTAWRCWWQNHKIVTFLLCWWLFNLRNRSPTSQSCHRNISSPTSVTNIDVSGWFWPKKKNFCHQIFTTRFCHQNVVINIKKSHFTITFFQNWLFQKTIFFDEKLLHPTNFFSGLFSRYNFFRALQMERDDEYRINSNAPHLYQNDKNLRLIAEKRKYQKISF